MRHSQPCGAPGWHITQYEQHFTPNSTPHCSTRLNFHVHDQHSDIVDAASTLNASRTKTQRVNWWMAKYNLLTIYVECNVWERECECVCCSSHKVVYIERTWIVSEVALLIIIIIAELLYAPHSEHTFNHFIAFFFSAAVVDVKEF